jgi:hypothetical protein
MSIQHSYTTHSERLPIYFFTLWRLVLRLAAPQLAPAVLRLTQAALVAEVALDNTGWLVVQLLHHTNIDRFHISPAGEQRAMLTTLQYVTPRSSHTSPGDRTEQHIQPIRTKKYKQGKLKQIMIGQRARRINWRADRGLWRELTSTLVSTQ